MKENTASQPSVGREIIRESRVESRPVNDYSSVMAVRRPHTIRTQQRHRPSLERNLHRIKKASGLKEHEPKISETTLGFMLSVAAIFDATQGLISLTHSIPVVGNAFAAIGAALIGFFAWLTFFLWFKINDVSFFKSKRAMKWAIGMLVGLVPVLNAMPEITLTVLMVALSDTKFASLGGIFNPAKRLNV